MPTELTDYATQQRDRLAQAKEDAQAALAQAQGDYAAARTSLVTAGTEITALETEVARIRAKLAAIVTPADGEPLLAELSQKTIELRAKQAAQLEAEEDVRVNQTAIERANAELTSLTAALTSAESTLAEATERETRRDAMFAKLNAAPLSGLPAAATTALASAPYTEAKARVEAEIPEALRELAAKRRENQLKLQTLRREFAGFSQGKIGDEQNQNGGAAGKAEKARAQFALAEEALRDFVVRGKERFDQARAMLAAVADPDKEPLTDAQKDEIQATNDAQLKTDREDAAAKALEVENKYGEVLDAEIKHERAVVGALALDVDVDLENVAAVNDAKGELETAEGELDTAKDEFTPAMRDLVNQWEAAVPDSAWRRFDNFLEAEATLKALSTTVTATLQSGYTTAEGIYGDALAERDKRARTLSTLEAERARSAARAEFHAAASNRLLFSALRGDK